MRKLTSKRNEKKKQRRNQIIVSLILIFVMFFSVIGYGFYQGDSEEDAQLEFNGYKFVSQDGLWFTQIGDFNFAFRNYPEEVESIGVSLNYLSSYSGKPLYISSGYLDAEQEIMMNLQQIVQRAQYACLDEENCDEGLPIKSCEDNFIIIEEAEINSIVQENNCVFIRGEKDKLVELSDEFLFKILGVQ